MAGPRGTNSSTFGFQRNLEASELELPPPPVTDAELLVATRVVPLGIGEESLFGAAVSVLLAFGICVSCDSADLFSAVSAGAAAGMIDV